MREDEILKEAHPYAGLGHSSALVFHGLTDDLPQAITAMLPSEGRAGLLLLGTEKIDWEGLRLSPASRFLQSCGGPLGGLAPTHRFTSRAHPPCEQCSFSKAATPSISFGKPIAVPVI